MKMVEKRKLGKSGIEVSAIGLGCMGLSHASGAPTEKNDAIKILREAFEMGYTLFDTAECYTGINPDGTISYNEELVGEALKPIRDQVVIATKCGVHHSEDKRLLLDSQRSTIRKSVEGSLKRLGTDYIDLYYQHRIDPKVAPEEVAETMADLIKEGKIRYWGISEVTEDYLRRAHAICPVSALENRFSMMARWYEDLFPVVEELGISFVAFSPLANGMLSGRYDQNTKFEKGTDYRSFMPQFTSEGVEKSRELLDFLNKLAKDKEATSAQISLAWMLGKKPWIIPIPGSRKIERLRENLNAIEIHLSNSEIAYIDGLLDQMDFLVFGGSSSK
jgi:aryl-alcohol dehydrogenase-like predicted oxidoreductase